MTRDSLVRALRTAGITFVTVFVPGMLGWINSLTGWANSHGQQPFPSVTVLGYLGISAMAAAATGTLNLVVNTVEDKTGRGLGRTVVRPEPGGAAATKAVSKRSPAAATRRGRHTAHPAPGRPMAPLPHVGAH